LPETLRQELESAVTLLDIERIAGIIAQISEQNAGLGSALKHQADTFAYTPILRALEGCRSLRTKASA
jgi:hypothetical protein